MIRLFAGVTCLITAEPIEVVAERYAVVWEDLPLTVDGTPDTQLVISAFHTREGLVESAVLSRRRGKTLVFEVTKDAWARPVRPSELPQVEGALFLHQVSARERTAVLPLPAAEAVRSRREAWQRAGFTPLTAVELVKGAARVRLTAAQIDESTTAVHEVQAE